MQRIDLKDEDSNIFCPFCGTHSINANEGKVDACEHLSYVAHEDGFEYKSEAFEALMSEEQLDELIEKEFMSGFSAKVDIAQAFELRLFASPPAPFGFYVAFQLIS